MSAELLDADVTKAVDDAIAASSGSKLTIYAVVKIAMHAVELWSKRQPLQGESKLAAAKELVPRVIQRAYELGVLTADESARLQQRLDMGVDVLEDVVDALMSVAHNPQFIQAVESVKRCCAERRKRKRETK